MIAAIMAEAHVNAHDDGGAKPKRGDPARVYVGNLSWTTTSEQLLAHMQQAGTVVFADILTGRDGRSRGCGYGSDER